MKLFLEERGINIPKVGTIVEVSKRELPFMKDAWKFNWRQLYNIPNARCYKLVAEESPYIIEGLLMLSLVNKEMVYMNNIEVAPHNFGKNGRYINVAACLIAFACHKSFEDGKGYYRGCLSFKSKTELISLYQKKYGAEIARGHEMFFPPNVGKQHISNHLIFNEKK